jgi:hypothetical protein
MGSADINFDAAEVTLLVAPSATLPVADGRLINPLMAVDTSAGC